MILALDVGNTNIVVGCGDLEFSKFKGRLTTNKSGTATEYAIRLKTMLQLYDVALEDIEGTIISSVVPELTYSLARALEFLTKKPPLIVKHTLKTGLIMTIDNPQTLGADRIVGSVAAIDKYKPPLAVFDVGTATTMDIIDKDYRHLGGCIMPGVKTSLHALSTNASQLPHIDIEEPTRLIGKNTIESMRSGLIYGNAAMLDGLIARAEEELGEKLTVIATGGLAKPVITHCKRDIIYDEGLLTRGLILIYYKNVKSE